MTREVTRALFLGSKDFGLRIFKELYSYSPNLIWTILHPIDIHDQRSSFSEFVDFARTYSIDFQLVDTRARSNQLWETLSPDVAFVCGWYWIIDSKYLESVPLGVWGIHNSLLPLYRGGSPLVWSIIEGAENVGFSIFKLADKMDAGEILFQKKIRLSLEDTIATALETIEKDVLFELSNLWKEILSDKPQTYEQNEEMATYVGQRSEKDGRIEWSENALSIHNFIRAQSKPYPGAYTLIKKKKLRIYKSEIIQNHTLAKPGQIIEVCSKDFIVSCGSQTSIKIIDFEICSSDVNIELIKGVRFDEN